MFKTLNVIWHATADYLKVETFPSIFLHVYLLSLTDFSSLGCSSGMSHQPIKLNRKDEPQFVELECYSKNRGVEGQSRCKAFYIHVSIILFFPLLIHTLCHTRKRYITNMHRLMLRKRSTARRLLLTWQTEATTSSTCTIRWCCRTCYHFPLRLLRTVVA